MRAQAGIQGPSVDTAQMANALGIAGSLCAGLLEFSKAGGGMEHLQFG